MRNSAQSVDYDGEMEQIREEKIRKVEQKKDKLLEITIWMAKFQTKIFCGGTTA